jgi:hypothetical protein
MEYPHPEVSCEEFEKKWWRFCGTIPPCDIGDGGWLLESYIRLGLLVLPFLFKLKGFFSDYAINVHLLSDGIRFHAHNHPKF